MELRERDRLGCVPRDDRACTGTWLLEFHCPRCDGAFVRWTPAYQRLAERLARR